MRAAASSTRAKPDVPALREQVDETLATAGWSLERFRGRSVLVEADRMVPRQVDGEVIGDGRRLNAHLQTGALVVRVPQPVAAAA